MVPPGCRVVITTPFAKEDECAPFISPGVEMKLIIAVVRDLDGDNVVHELITKGYRVTRLSSTGGFWRRGNVTLLIGANDEQVSQAIESIRSACLPEEPGQHRATVFIVDLPYFKHI